MNKVILVIRDGWGFRAEKDLNAIYEADTPVAKKLAAEYPSTLIECAGTAVGLPDGFQGNSEVGHLTIGSGRIIYQPMVRIDNEIKNGGFFKNPIFMQAIENCRKNDSTFHIIGIAQVEGVHGHLNHILALLDLCKKVNYEKVKIHVLTDGRDAPVTDSLEHIKTIEEKLKEIGFGEIATVSGRYYAMDRDKRWDRTKKAFDCIARGFSEVKFTDALESVKQSHTDGITDEFIVPRQRQGYSGISDGDSIVFSNFRTDRTRQLTKAIVEKEFEGSADGGWERSPFKVCFVAMTNYYSGINGLVAFEDISLDNLLGEVISAAGLKQLRISETEKYAHVTFFFNGQKETPSEGEERILIPSPKVATYDLEPEMSVFKVAQALVEQINANKFELIVVNLVNCDLVGHTAVREAIKRAVEAVDKTTGMIVNAGLQNGYTLLVFADHGNAEDQTAEWSTSHTINPVPLALVSNNPMLKNRKLKSNKGLQDIAPTVLEIMGLEKPAEMSGESLLL